MSARDDYPKDLGLNVAGYARQYEQMCDEIDRLRYKVGVLTAVVADYAIGDAP